jgi:hypothetical protein
MIAVRAVTADDMPLLEGWAKRRGCALSAGLVSPHGFLAELDGVPMMCAWGAMILDTPFVEIDHVYASPRVTKKTGLEAWARLIAAFRTWANAINEQCGQQVAALKIAMNADMAPYARKTGGAVGNMPLLNCIYSMEVSHGN